LRPAAGAGRGRRGPGLRAGLVPGGPGGRGPGRGGPGAVAATRRGGAAEPARAAGPAGPGGAPGRGRRGGGGGGGPEPVRRPADRGGGRGGGGGPRGGRWPRTGRGGRRPGRGGGPPPPGGAPTAAGGQAAAETWGYPDYLLELARRECQQRRENRVSRLLKASKLPLEKSWAALDLKRLPVKAVQQLRGLLSGDFLDRRENVLAFG